MKTTIKLLVWIAALTLTWGCSSGDDEKDNLNPQSQTNSPLSNTEKPSWAINWSWTDPAPNWQAPESTEHECSMDILVELDEPLNTFSKDNDRMALFIGNECRGVSLPSFTKDGHVLFLIHVKGDSEEAGQSMELRYYCASMMQLFIDADMPSFTPSNLMDETHQIKLSPIGSSTKYPFTTELTVKLPEAMPYSVSDDDMMAVFVDGECRGLCIQTQAGWKGDIFSSKAEEMAQLRYYNAQRGEILNIGESFKLNNSKQQVNIKL